MTEQDDRSEVRPTVFRLGLTVWLQKDAHLEEHDEWRGKVYDQLEPKLHSAFRGLGNLAAAVKNVARRISAGDRAVVGRHPTQLKYERAKDANDG